MIEKTILDYLNDNLNVSVYMEVPDDPPANFIVIERIGSSRVDLLNSASFAIQSYSDTLYKTVELNEAVKDAMMRIKELDNISSCTLDRDYNFTDTSTKRYRYQALFIITHY